MNYYEVLGLNRDASQDEIKKAYKKLAIRYHPDKSKEKESDQKFKQISEAYEILSDPQKRSQYDRFGSVDLSGIRLDPTEIFKSIFGDFFHKRRVVQPGPDVKIQTEIDIFDAVKGIKKEISYNKPVKCKICNGSGLRADADLKPCPVCNGKGVRIQQQGFLTIQSPCSACQGIGTRRDNNSLCPACLGEKFNNEQTTIEINLPAGIPNNAILRLPHQGGESLRGGPSGNVFIKVIVKDNVLLKRVEDDLVATLPINVHEAILGSDRPVVFPNKTVKDVQIPPGSQPGDFIRIHNVGLPLPSGKKGDFVIELMVEIPKNIEGDLISSLKKFEIKNQTDFQKTYNDLIEIYKSENRETKSTSN